MFFKSLSLPIKIDSDLSMLVTQMTSVQGEYEGQARATSSQVAKYRCGPDLRVSHYRCQWRALNPFTWAMPGFTRCRAK